MEDYDEFDDKVPLYLLRKSNLSWDERQIIEFVRRNPDKKAELLEVLKEKDSYR